MLHRLISTNSQSMLGYIIRFLYLMIRLFLITLKIMIVLTTEALITSDSNKSTE